MRLTAAVAAIAAVLTSGCGGGGVNADGMDDLYFCYRTGTDQLYIRNP